jgi:hypothetical protein
MVTCGLATQNAPAPDDERREQIETIIIGKFANEMNLTPEEAEKFYPRLRQFRNETESMSQEQREIKKQLEEFSGRSDVAPQMVNELFDRNDRIARALLDRKRQFLSEISTFLNPQQVSRCSILLDELPRRMRQLAREHGGGDDHKWTPKHHGFNQY